MDHTVNNTKKKTKTSEQQSWKNKTHIQQDLMWQQMGSGVGFSYMHSLWNWVSDQQAPKNHWTLPADLW